MSQPANLLTPPEIARRFHVHQHTVRRWIEQGKLRSFKTMGGHNRVRADDVRRLLIEHIDERMTFSIPSAAETGTEQP